MATCLGILRGFIAVLLGLAIFGAFMSWMVLSTVLNDMDLNEAGQDSLLPSIADDLDLGYESDIRRDLDQARDGLEQARSVSFWVVVLGAALMGLMYLPHLASCLRWPGYTLLCVGLVAFVLGWLARSGLPGLAAGSVGFLGSEERVRANMELFLQGFGNSGLWLALAGAALLAASYGWSRWKGSS